MSTLPISNVISVNVSFPPTGVGIFNVNNLALFTSDAFLSNTAGDKYRVYNSAQSVGSDFGTTTETYQQAVAIFSQQPNVLAGGGNLLIFPSFTATTIASVSITNAGTGYVVGDILNIGTDSGAYGGTVTVATVYAGTITSVTLTTGGIGYSTGAGHATTGGTGTGATINVVSLTTETLAQAIARVAGLVFFCGIISTSYGANTTWLALAAVVQSYGNKILFLPSTSLTDIPGIFTTIKNATDYFTRCLYYSTSALTSRLFAAAYAARLLSVNFAGSFTAITMNLKQLSTITIDPGIDSTVAANCVTAGVDVYGSYAGTAAVISNGANKYADQAFNLIWFVSALQVSGYNALATLSTKIPQTEPGMNLYKGALKQVCEQALANGYVAPGTWTATDTFGDQANFLSNILTKGYYIYSAPINQQTVAARAARQAPLVQIAIKEAGAIQSSVINVYVNP